MDTEIQQILEEHVLPTIAQEESASPLTALWLLVDRQKHRIVGSIVFKSPPDETGAATIGYSTEKGYHNQGYMTEALAGLIEWSIEQSPIHILRTDVPLDHTTAQKVLLDNQFEPYQTTQERQYWRRILR